MTIIAKQQEFSSLPPEIYGHWTTDKIKFKVGDVQVPTQGFDDILTVNPFVTDISCEEAVLQIEKLRAKRKLIRYDYD